MTDNPAYKVTFDVLRTNGALQRRKATNMAEHLVDTDIVETIQSYMRQPSVTGIQVTFTPYKERAPIKRISEHLSIEDRPWSAGGPTFVRGEHFKGPIFEKLLGQEQVELQKCKKPDCDHLIKKSVEYCCGACEQAHRKGYEIHEDGSPLGHGVSCLARHARRGPAPRYMFE